MTRLDLGKKKNIYKGGVQGKMTPRLKVSNRQRDMVKGKPTGEGVVKTL